MRASVTTSASGTRIVSNGFAEENWLQVLLAHRCVNQDGELKFPPDNVEEIGTTPCIQSGRIYWFAAHWC